MDRKQKIRLAAMLMLKNHFLFERKLKLLLLKLLHNVKVIHALAASNLNLLLQLGIAVGQSEIRDRQSWKFDRNSTFWECDVLEMDDKQFKENFRLTRKTFQKVCEKVKNIEKSNTNMRRCIPLDKRVAIALFALGSAAEYRIVGSLFGVGRSSVGEIVIDFSNAICNNLASYINSYPPHPEEIKHIVDGFQQLGFPQCFGAVDACHIQIQPKKEDAGDYQNYKGWHSIVLLASCDHRSKFTYVNIGSSGKYNDSYIFEHSSLKKYHEEAEIFTQNTKVIADIKVPLLLIGDSAFRLSRYMMKPFPYTIYQTEVEKTFNHRLSRCRRVIKNAFGELKARFRRISRGLQVQPKNAITIIKTCCILHNFLKMENDEVSSAWLEYVASDLATQSQPNHLTKVGENDETASAIRNAIALSFMDDTAAADDVNMMPREDSDEEGDESNSSDVNDCDADDG